MADVPDGATKPGKKKSRREQVGSTAAVAQKNAEGTVEVVAKKMTRKNQNETVSTGNRPSKKPTSQNGSPSLGAQMHSHDVGEADHARKDDQASVGEKRRKKKKNRKRENKFKLQAIAASEPRGNSSAALGSSGEGARVDANIKQGKDDKKRARSVEGARLDAAMEVRQTMKGAAKPVLAKGGGVGRAEVGHGTAKSGAIGAKTLGRSAEAALVTSKMPRMSPLQVKMAKKLQGAHFRMLNEELYTTPSTAAVDLFERDTSLFEAYHIGFREQTKRWPQNPVELIIKELRKHPRAWVIADLGCGDARVAQVLPNRVHSFDLVANNERVVACDIAKVPLKDASTNAVVLSLALMGTNYDEFLREAHRIIPQGGRVYVAEVRSRVEHVLDDFRTMLSTMGFRVDKCDTSNTMFIMLFLTKVAPFDSSYKAPPLKACQYKKR